MRRLVLASSSPRRRDLLARLHIPFETVPSAVEETVSADLPVTTLARALALAKVRDVAARVLSDGGDPAVVLGADTLVAVDGRPLGKPSGRDHAREMLWALRGRTHEVVTGVALVDTRDGRETVETVVSRVTMRPYSTAELEAYLVTDEPYDKAGAYAVQGAGGRLVLGVDGCYTNVVGLPLTTTARLLRHFDFPTAPPGGP